VYGVPDPQVGDLVMAALELRPGVPFDVDRLRAFLDVQPDLGTKMTPRFIRIVNTIPVTSTMKPVRRELRREAWLCDDVVWWRASPRDDYLRLLSDADIVDLRAAFERHGREAFYPAL
jgi:fatty-acyl-CoA synthase